MNIYNNDHVDRQDFIIVDPSIPTQYPLLAGKMLYPSKFVDEVKRIEMPSFYTWNYQEALPEFSKGVEIFEHLGTSGLLKSCIGLPELEAIQKKGVGFYFHNFGIERCLFAWGAILKTPNGDFRVPYLVYYQGEIVLCIYWLGAIWHDEFDALLYK